METAREGLDQTNAVPASDAVTHSSSLYAQRAVLPVLAAVAMVGCGESSQTYGTLPPIKPLPTTTLEVDVTTVDPGAPVVVEREKSPAMTDLSSVYWGRVCKVPGFTDRASGDVIADRALSVAVLPLEPRRADPYVQAFAYEAVRAGAKLDVVTCVEGAGAGLQVLVISYSEQASVYANVSEPSNLAAFERVFGPSLGRERWKSLDPNVMFDEHVMIPVGVAGEELPRLRSFSQFAELHDQFRSGQLRASETTLKMFADFVSEASIIELKAAQAGSSLPLPEFAVIGVSIVGAPDRNADVVIKNADGSTAPSTARVQYLLLSTTDGLGFLVPVIDADGAYRAYDA